MAANISQIKQKNFFGLATVIVVKTRDIYA